MCRQADLRQTAAAYITLAKAVDTLFLMYRRSNGVDEGALDWKETVRNSEATGATEQCYLCYICTARMPLFGFAHYHPYQDP